MTTIISPSRELFWKNTDYISVFLAGTIEMGKGNIWRDRVIEEGMNFSDINCLNPRRKEFPDDVNQSVNDPIFLEQVEWELDAIEIADIVFMYIDPLTTSPVTLIELGLCAGRKELILCCPDGYFKKGNVDIVAKRYGIFVHNSLDTAIPELKRVIYKTNRNNRRKK